LPQREGEKPWHFLILTACFRQTRPTRIVARSLNAKMRDLPRRLHAAAPQMKERHPAGSKRLHADGSAIITTPIFPPIAPGLRH